MKKSKMLLSGMCICLFVCTLLTVAAQSQYKDPRAAEILEVVRQNYEKSITGIDDYTVVTEHFSTQYVKKYDNDRPYFVSQVETESFWGSVSAMGMHTTSPMVDSDFFMPEMFSHLKKNLIYKGTEHLNGLNTHVLFLEDMRVFFDVFDDVEEPLGSLTLYFDDEHWVLRQMRFSAEAELEDGQFQLIEPVLRMEDYRNINGMMVPFKTAITISGLMDHLSDEEREEAKEALAEFERELRDMPPQQRQMIEDMMGGQLDDLRKMIEEDSIEFLIEVLDVKVNTGLREQD